MSQRHLYVIRHGQRLSGNGNDRLGLGITDIGKIQAEHTAERLQFDPGQLNLLQHVATGFGDSKNHLTIFAKGTNARIPIVMGMHPLPASGLYHLV